jgi:hypothetical protein
VYASHASKNSAGLGPERSFDTSAINIFSKDRKFCLVPLLRTEKRYAEEPPKETSYLFADRKSRGCAHRFHPSRSASEA